MEVSVSDLNYDFGSVYGPFQYVQPLYQSSYHLQGSHTFRVTEQVNEVRTIC